jgi:hypothetical protein
MIASSPLKNKLYTDEKFGERSLTDGLKETDIKSGVRPTLLKKCSGAIKNVAKQLFMITKTKSNV